MHRDPKKYKTQKSLVYIADSVLGHIQVHVGLCWAAGQRTPMGLRKRLRGKVPG